MYTYQMTIVNKDGRRKTVIVSGDTYMSAVRNMRKEYGADWTVSDSPVKIIFANY